MVITDYNKRKVTAPADLAKILLSILQLEDEIDQDKEHFWAIGLTPAKTIKYIDLTSLGILDQGLVHPREVYRFAIMKGCESVIIAHNHPSGSLNPSVEDIRITSNLVKAGQIIGIALLDHIIIAEGAGFTSFKEQGLM